MTRSSTRFAATVLASLFIALFTGPVHAAVAPTTDFRFIEANTSALPNAVDALVITDSLVQVYSVAPPTTSVRECAYGMGCATMKLSEANLFLGTVSDDAAPVTTSTVTSRFIEVNTVMLPSADASPFYAASDPMRH